MGARRATTSEFAAVTGLLEDTPVNVIIGHFVRQGRVAAWIVGDSAAAPEAVAFEHDGDLHGIGSASAIAEVAIAVPDWHSFSAGPEIADELEGQLRELAPNLERFDDLHFLLEGPPATRRRHPGVRIADGNDLAAVAASGLWSDKVEIQQAVDRGRVACAFVGGAVVGGAACIASSARYGDVGVQVLEEHRRQGIAASAAALVCANLQREGRTPVWSTPRRNEASLGTAASLGFEPTDGLVVMTRFEG